MAKKKAPLAVKDDKYWEKKNARKEFKNKNREVKVIDTGEKTITKIKYVKKVKEKNGEKRREGDTVRGD